MKDPGVCYFMVMVLLSGAWLVICVVAAERAERACQRGTRNAERGMNRQNRKRHTLARWLAFHGGVK